MSGEGQEAADRIWLVLESLAAANPAMPLQDGVLLAQKVYRDIQWARAEGISVPPPFGGGGVPASFDPAVLGTWLGGQKAVTDHLPAKPISAIKEARAVAGCSLKEAKDAVDWLRVNWDRIQNP